MEKISRMWRSGLSLILALCLIISACPVVAFAATDKVGVDPEGDPAVAKYVSIGDSMANGYGLEGYTDDSTWGYLNENTPAYPVEVAKEMDWDLTQLALSGFRAHEVCYLLGLTDYVDEYLDAHDGRWNHNGGYDEVSNTYKQSIADADVISIGLGSNNFGTFFMRRVFNYLMDETGGNMMPNDVTELLATVDADVAAMAKPYVTMMNAKMDEMLADAGITEGRLYNVCHELADAAVYSTVDFVIHHKLLLDYIAENNPDAEVILVGMTNSAQGLVITAEGKSIDVGEYYAYLVNAANAYMYGLAAAYETAAELDETSEYGLKVYFAELGYVEQVADELQSAVDAEGLTRARFVSNIAGSNADGLIFGLLKGAMPIPLVGLTLADVEAYEDGNVKPMNGMELNAKYASAAVYMALENAIIKAVEEEILDISSMTALANGFDASLFEGVMEAFVAEAAALSAKPEVITQAATALSGIANNLQDDIAFTPEMVAALVAKGEAANGIISDIAFEMATAVINAQIGQNFSVGDIKGLYNNDDTYGGAITGAVNAAKAEANTMIYETYDLDGNFENICMLFTLEDALTAALASDTAIMSLLNLYGRYKVGDGVAIHPSVAGHQTIKKAVLDAYKTDHTAKDEVVENVEFALSALKDFLEEYGPEYAEQAYNYLNENGYIDMAYTEVENLIKYLTENADALVNEMIPAVEAAIEALKAQGIELKGQLEALKVALEQKQAELETAVGEAAEQIKAAIAQIEEAIAEIEELIAQVEEQIEELTDVLDIMMQTATAIAEQVGVAIENAEELIETITELVETLKNSGEMTVEAIIEAVEEARESVLEAAETLYKAIDVITKRVSDIAVRAEQVNKQITELYNNTVETLKQIITELPVEYQAIVAGAYLAIEQGLEAAIALVEEELEAAIEALTEKIEAEIEAKRAELDAILSQIDACVEAKYNELKAEADKQIEAIRAAAEAEIAKIEAEIEKIRTEAEKAVEALTAHVEEQIEAIRAEAEAKIEALKSLICEKKAALESLYAELENAAEDAKEEILNKIEAIEAEIEALEQQIEDIIAAVEAEIEALNAQIEAIIADAEAKIEALNAQIEAIVAEVEAKIEKINADLEAAVEEFRAQVEAEYSEIVGAIEKAISDLETKLEKGIEELKQAAEAEITKLKEAAGEELEKLENLIEGVVNGTIEQIEEKLNTVHDTVKELMNSSIENAEELVKQLGEDLKVLGEEAVDALVENVENAMHDAFVKATTSDLELSEESVYVALGDGTAAPESYAEVLAAQLKAEYGVTGFMNYAEDGNTVGNEIEDVATREGIADADLITIGFGNVDLMDNALDNAYADVPVDYDWAELVGEELVPYVEDALADVYAEVEAAVPDASIAGIVNMIVEGVAYGAVEYALELPALISAIRAVNTDAVIVIVGQYNPMDGVVLEMPGSTLDMSEYLDSFVEAVAAHGIAYSMITGDAIFVEAPEVETESADKSWDPADMSKFFRNGFGKLNPSEDGDAYIANQILDALNITKIEVEPEGLLGDANDDGVVDMKDIIRIRKYLADPDVTPINMENADVNLDGVIDMKDIIRMRKHLADGVALG